MNEIVAMLLIALLGAALVLSGIFMLAGAAWTLIAGGAFLFAVSAVIRRGVYRA